MQRWWLLLCDKSIVGRHSNAETINEIKLPINEIKLTINEIKLTPNFLVKCKTKIRDKLSPCEIYFHNQHYFSKIIIILVIITQL